MNENKTPLHFKLHEYHSSRSMICTYTIAHVSLQKMRGVKSTCAYNFETANGIHIAKAMRKTLFYEMKSLDVIRLHKDKFKRGNGSTRQEVHIFNVNEMDTAKSTCSDFPK